MTATFGDAGVVRDRFRIDPERPLPEFDSGASRAFAAVDLRDSGSDYFALLPELALPLRLSVVARLRRVDNNHLIKAQAWDVLVWDGEGRRRPVVVFERPKGGRLFPTPDTRIEPFREEAMVRRFLQPFAVLLEDMSFAGIAHRNIRAENLFLDGGDPHQSAIMLGECVSAPPAYAQPVVYETIECGMAHPAGRGEGSQSNDFYALGVTAAFLLAGRNTTAGLTDQQIVEQKLASGSYAVLLGNVRVPTSLVEVFRGLLNDEPSERWGYEDLQLWIGGRRASPKQQLRPSRASRPLEIGGRSYITARSVAEALSRRWEEGLELVQQGEVDDWLRRGLADEDRIEAVNAAKSYHEDEDTASDTLLARICFALDPAGPLRVRGFRAMLDGMATMLASGFMDETMREIFVSILQERLPDFCVRTNNRLRADIYRQLGSYERLTPTIARDDIGYGIERALYVLNPQMPCLSPLFAKDYVVELDQLLPALDRLAQLQGDTLDSLIDRHVAAFIAAHLKVPVAPELREMRDAADHVAYALPAARILALVDMQVSGPPVPALCALLVRMLEPALERFHNRHTRDEVRERMRGLAEAGRLDELVGAVIDPAALQLDEQGFASAVAQYEATLQQLEKLAYERENRVPITRMISNQVASLMSGAIATIAVLVTILANLI